MSAGNGMNGLTIIMNDGGWMDGDGFIQPPFFKEIRHIEYRFKLKGLKCLMQSSQVQIIKAERPPGNEYPPTLDSKIRFEIFGKEMLVREVKISGNSGRAYMPKAWIGKRVKIILVD